jgi:adenylate kinase family enzyme
MQKEIHIIGGQGSAKTCAGAAIPERHGLRHLDHDVIFWDRDTKTFGTRADRRLRDDALAEFIALSAWIVEDAYVSNWLPPGFAAADSIIAIGLSVFVRD